MSELILWVNGLILWVNELILWVSEHMLWVSELILWVPVNKSAPVNKVSPAVASVEQSQKAEQLPLLIKELAIIGIMGEGRGRLLTGGGGYVMDFHNELNLK